MTNSPRLVLILQVCRSSRDVLPQHARRLIKKRHLHNFFQSFSDSQSQVPSTVEHQLLHFHMLSSISSEQSTSRSRQTAASFLFGVHLLRVPRAAFLTSVSVGDSHISHLSWFLHCCPVKKVPKLCGEPSLFWVGLLLRSGACRVWSSHVKPSRGQQTPLQLRESSNGMFFAPTSFCLFCTSELNVIKYKAARPQALVLWTRLLHSNTWLAKLPVALPSVLDKKA